jgi:hypothetical protein
MGWVTGKQWQVVSDKWQKRVIGDQVNSDQKGKGGEGQKERTK